MKSFFRHIKKYVLRGLLAIVPLALCFFSARILYTTIDGRFTPMVEKIVGFTFPGPGILLLLATLYVLGVVTTNVVGREFFGTIQRIANRIPLIKTIYQLGRQLAVTLSLREKQVFKRAVLVEYLKPGIWTIGFVTGTVSEKKRNDETLLKVFVPTPANPTSVTVVAVRESQTRDPGWSIEEALKYVISVGGIGPTEIR
jgi:uncharacterized membrane protein